ncbi:MAG: hypothetical protein IKF91_02565 [Bacilli bacterium]|nr:hypothetical protein [Bacilli bacterium]
MIYFYISLLTYYVYMTLKYKDSLVLLQKTNYNSAKYKKSINKKVFINKELIIILLIIIAVNFNLKTIEIATIITYMILSLLKLKDKNKIKIEKKLIIRLLTLLTVFILLNIWFILDYKSYHNPKGLIFDNTALYYIILYLFTYTSYLITLIINVIVKPIDKLLK